MRSKAAQPPNLGGRTSAVPSSRVRAVISCGTGVDSHGGLPGVVAMAAMGVGVISADGRFGSSGRRGP